MAICSLSLLSMAIAACSFKSLISLQTRHTRVSLYQNRHPSQECFRSYGCTLGTFGRMKFNVGSQFENVHCVLSRVNHDAEMLLGREEVCKKHMLADDVYGLARKAHESDLSGMRQIMQPLEEAGILIGRTEEDILERLKSYIVVERQGLIIACAALFPYFNGKCGEVAAFAVSEKCCGQGHGGKFLDDIEKMAASMGLEMLFLLTTCTGDWFAKRGYSECSIEIIPEERRKTIDLARKSKYYTKRLDQGILQMSRGPS